MATRSPMDLAVAVVCTNASQSDEEQTLKERCSPKTGGAAPVASTRPWLNRTGGTSLASARSRARSKLWKVCAGNGRRKADSKGARKGDEATGADETPLRR